MQSCTCDRVIPLSPKGAIMLCTRYDKLTSTPPCTNVILSGSLWPLSRFFQCARKTSHLGWGHKISAARFLAHYRFLLLPVARWTVEILAKWMIQTSMLLNDMTLSPKDWQRSTFFSREPEKTYKSSLGITCKDAFFCLCNILRGDLSALTNMVLCMLILSRRSYTWQVLLQPAGFEMVLQVGCMKLLNMKIHLLKSECV
jgi:hypothetical protein